MLISSKLSNMTQISPDVQRRLDQGKLNEIHGTATICAVLMPALLPSCMQLVENGYTFIEGDVIQKLLEVSIDGVIGCQNGFHQRPCN